MSARRSLRSLSLRWGPGEFSVLDQTRLPHEEVWLPVRDSADMISHIQRLAVRGAPLIGVAAALALAQEAERGVSGEALRAHATALRASRPTAVNLMNAIDRMLAVGPSEYTRAAEELFLEDESLCRRMSERAAFFLQHGDGVLTHCNTGGLATVGVGTALGAIRLAFEAGKCLHVYVDETRPLGQGARLTAWELGRLGIPFTLITDNMAAALMAKGRVQHCIVGADRIAVNGDVANKIGTYGVAVLAHYHGVPFTVVAPSTTLDPLCADGGCIEIEERGAGEVRGSVAPADAPVWNPAFDVTPRKLITRIVLEDRLF